MTNLRKSALAVAVVAGLALSGMASAYTVTNTGSGATATFTPEGIAYFDVSGSASQAVGIYTPTTTTFTASDNIVGRTTGFALRVTLSGAAQFAGMPTVSGSLGGVAIGTSTTGWAASVSTSGNIAIITFTPGSGATAIEVGDTIVLGAPGLNTDELTPTTAGVLQFSNIQALAASGQSVQGTYQFYDPVTTQPILGSQTVTFLQSGNPIATSAQASATNAKIDLGATPSQAFLSPCGAIGGSNDPTCFDNSGSSTTTTFDAGSISAAVTPSTTGPNFAYFSFASTDKFTTTLTGNFSAFAQTGSVIGLYPGSNGKACGGTAVATAATPTGNTATLTFSGTAAAISEGPYELCLTEPNTNTMPIAATSLNVSTSFTRSSTTVAGTSQPLAPLAYNAPVAQVYTFNPAGNSTQQSFLRITDAGPLAGKVNISGIDDAGNPGASVVSLMMNAGQSVQLSSSCLQSGTSCPAGVAVTGALGTGTGKWRLTVFSYFPGLVVTSLNRNNNTGTVTNLTTASVGQ